MTTEAKTRILTVDDSASMRALLRHALTAQGFHVEQAEDGVAALDWLNDNECDVIITDINMPRMDGFGLIEQVRSGSGGSHAQHPILVLTTEASDEKKARARSAGATGWIVKPFDADKLAAAVRRVSH
ncbi:MAG: response regulator [Sphingomonas sp.]